MIIDTHMHIYDDKYNGNSTSAIEESINLGVKKMICAGTDYESSLKCIEFSNKYEEIYACVGLYPENACKDSKYLSWLSELIKNKKVIGIGEIGLDYYWDKSFIDKQKEVFIKQIEFASSVNLPIVVHSRDAIQDTYDILKEHKARGVIHCYGGSLEMAREFVKLGYFLGIGGVVTFKNAKEIIKVVEEIDPRFLLTETDSPYLTPVPHRGEINIPGYTKYVLEKIAEIKQMDVKELENIIENNVLRIFGI